MTEMTRRNTEGEDREISVEMVEVMVGAVRDPLTAAPTGLPDRGALDF